MIWKVVRPVHTVLNSRFSSSGHKSSIRFSLNSSMSVIVVLLTSRNLKGIGSSASVGMNNFNLGVLWCLVRVSDVIVQ